MWKISDKMSLLNSKGVSMEYLETCSYSLPLALCSYCTACMQMVDQHHYSYSGVITAQHEDNVYIACLNNMYW